MSKIELNDHQQIVATFFDGCTHTKYYNIGNVIELTFTSDILETRTISIKILSVLDLLVGVSLCREQSESQNRIDEIIGEIDHIGHLDQFGKWLTVLQFQNELNTLIKINSSSVYNFTYIKIS